MTHAPWAQHHPPGWWGPEGPPEWRMPRWASLWLPVIMSFAVQVPSAIIVSHLTALPPQQTALSILIAVISNTLVKCGISAGLGGPRLRRSALVLTTALVAIGAVAFATL